MNNKINVRDLLTETELLAQLAEECAELAKAALKLRRAIDKTNPTPITEKEAREQLTEEVSDVGFVLRELGVSIDEKIVAKKKVRWIGRLSKREG